MLLTTESANPASSNLDQISSKELVELINSEDAKIAAAVGSASMEIAIAIDIVVDRLRSGGRLIYIGAGTSGRLGVLDAAECPPTFNSAPDQVLALIAGGRDALVDAAEDAEDSSTLAETDLAGVNLSAADVVVGISASGATPYVIAALSFARKIGAATIGFACNRSEIMCGAAEHTVTVVVGPEVLTGSTRMKAGTATKMVLNMLSTGAMVMLGKTYSNMMIDLRATNVKLVRRATGLVNQLTGLNVEESRALLTRCGGEVKTAVVCHVLHVDTDAARAKLQEAGGRLRRVLDGHV